ncbi:MAG: NAD(P)/FAD-dependent oxidoreductase [Bacteroidia bacterium]
MYDVIILGGGASGIFTAANIVLLAPKTKVLIIEKSNKLLAKVKISGGGRCNVTHAEYENKELVKNYPRGNKALMSVFSRFSTYDTIDWFAQQGIELHAEADGRMFPSTNTSQTIIDCLLKIITKANVEIQLSTQVAAIAIAKNISITTLHNEQETLLKTKKIVLATGGYAKDENYTWLRQLGYEVAKPVPSLFTFNIPKHAITQLMGVAVSKATVTILNTKTNYTGPVLITHWGLSGPAVIKLSAFDAVALSALNYNYTVQVNWLDYLSIDDALELLLEQKNSSPKKNIYTYIPNFNNEQFPKRLWQFLCEDCGINERLDYANISKAQAHKLSTALCAYTLKANGKTTYKEEFVTAGGVNIDLIDTKTFCSKQHPNLYFAGEVLNVDGITGGFNFQFAWSSGYIAAQDIVKTLSA